MSVKNAKIEGRLRRKRSIRKKISGSGARPRSPPRRFLLLFFALLTQYIPVLNFRNLWRCGDQDEPRHHGKVC